ncbi:hypothetical protein C1645_742950 [Glomus cerebriforme]|uniref:Uncharacterized protein n=1 Tax=Glomus cerebriforme TaxID=658196 RepID=A0A397SLY1_9GLOM|nr:hypothetical protein C1645_742950 [Glomus cerebriforme]
MKLIAITPHAAGCEQSGQDLAGITLLWYWKKAVELQVIIQDAKIFDDDEVLELNDDSGDNNSELEEEERLTIEDLTNLDAEVIVVNLGEIIGETNERVRERERESDDSDSGIENNENNGNNDNNSGGDEWNPEEAASQVTFSNVSVVMTPKQMPELNYYRNLWWSRGEISLKAKWEEVTLPYVLVNDVSLDEYELRADKFNVHGTRADDSGKEADVSFRPMKARVPAPTGSNGKSEPWPNIIVEVAYTESVEHVFEKVKDYWLKNLSRAHDAIIVKIDPVPDDQTPSRMQFEFGTQDGADPPNQLNILQGTCLINISLNCLYHQVYTGVQVPQGILPDPIVLDFFYVRDEFLHTFRI